MADNKNGLHIIRGSSLCKLGIKPCHLSIGNFRRIPGVVGLIAYGDKCVAVNYPAVVNFIYAFTEIFVVQFNIILPCLFPVEAGLGRMTDIMVSCRDKSLSTVRHTLGNRFEHCVH